MSQLAGVISNTKGPMQIDMDQVIVTKEPCPFDPERIDVTGAISDNMESGRTMSCNRKESDPELNPDFRTIRIISSLVLFFLKKCWMMCSTGLFVTFIVYWCYGSMVAFALFIFGLSGLFYQISDWLLYHPDEPSHSRIYVPMPSLLGLPWEKFFLKTQDGVRIHAVFIKQPQAIVSQVPTILFFHGNAGNIGHRLAFVQGFYNVCRCNILLLEYRGYGHSDGYPSENGLYIDAQTGLKFLLQLPYIDRRKIVVFGRSLGGAVAIDLVSRPEYARHVLALIVENTFTSIPQIAQEMFKLSVIEWLPVWAYKNKFSSVAKIGCVKRPALFISGQADTLISPEMMRKLIELCGSSIKRLQLFPNGTHNETWRCKGYYRSINMFLDDRCQLLWIPHSSYGSDSDTMGYGIDDCFYVMLVQEDPHHWSFQNFNSKGPIEIY